MLLFLLIISLSTISFTSSTPCPDGTLLPDPTDCSKFYKCHAGSLHSQSCPGSPQHLLWNVELARCDWPEAVDCVKVAVEKSVTIVTTVRKTEDHISHKNPFLAGLALTGAPGGSRLVSQGERRVPGQPVGSILVQRGGETGQQVEQRMSVKFVPREVARYEEPLRLYQDI